MSRSYRLLSEGMPPPRSAGSTTFVADARKARQWVAALPRANALSTQQSLGQALDSLASQRLDGAQRLGGLEGLRPAIGESIGLPTGPEDGRWLPVAKGYVWSLAPLLLPAMAGSVVGLVVGAPIALLALAVAAGLVVLRYFEWLHTRYALDEGHLFVERGWWRHRRLILPVRRIQSIDIAENFWMRRLGYCAIHLGVAGGSGLSIHAIPALTRVDAEALRGQLLSA